MLDAARPYPAYKDSGQPWLGEVPEHWEIRRAKYLVKERDQRWDDDVGRLLSVSQYTGVTERRKREGTEEHDTRSDSLRGYKVVARDDLVVNIMLAWNGSMGVSAFDGVASPAYSVFRFREGEPWYFHTLLRMPVYKGEIKRRSRGVVESRLRLYPDDLGRLPTLVPPPPEQSAIVKVLSAVDRRVNRLVRAKRRLLALLAEQKQAVITHAVTRGLDPTAPTKPSGVPWLGEVPKHWEVTNLGRIAQSFRTGPFGSTLHQSDYVVGGVPVINPVHMRDARLRPSVNVAVSEETAQRLAAFVLREGDVVFSRRGELGRFAIVQHDDPACLCGTGSLRVRLQYDQVTQEFLSISLQLPGVVDHLRSSSIGATMESLNTADLKGVPIVLPQLGEQRQIVARVEQECQKLDTAADLARREIDLIREYRTRLMADVVTGKLDVRAVAEALPDEADEEPIEPEDAEVENEAEELEPALAGEDVEDK